MNHALCECGCGNPAPIARLTDRARGYVKGESRRFIAGHNSRRRGLSAEGHRTYIQNRVALDATGCWLWQGARTGAGYGAITADRQMLAAHRVSYEAFRDAIPAGLVIDHLCRVRHCVNPDHLEVVTQAENMRRGANTKLNARDVAAIRRSSDSGRVIAETFGVSQTLVSRVRLHQAWVA